MQIRFQKTLFGGEDYALRLIEKLKSNLKKEAWNGKLTGYKDGNA
jgi:hypothetical protein